MRVTRWEMRVKNLTEDQVTELRGDLKRWGFVVLDERQHAPDIYLYEVGVTRLHSSATRVYVTQNAIEIRYRTIVAVKGPLDRVRLRWWKLPETRFHWWPRFVRLDNGCTDVSWLWWTWYNEPETDAERAE